MEGKSPTIISLDIHRGGEERPQEKRIRVNGDVDEMIKDAHERHATDHAEAMESMLNEAWEDVRQLRKPDSEIDEDLKRMGII